ncbi:MAG: hypothetical protein J1F24_07515 [Oscillospiraceae bacterium]|nr:hypothetical protein [Oscillospiraceae bacterium]
MKKIGAVIISVIILMFIPISCYAYNAGDSLDVSFKINDLPAQTAGIDILVQIDKQSDEYVSLNTYTDLLGINDFIEITDESQISYYDTNGYISYLCHFNGAIIDYLGCYQEYSEELNVKVNNLDYFVDKGSIIIAFIDKEGTVLSTSTPISIKNGLFRQFRSLSLNNHKVTVDYYYNPYYILPSVVLITAVVILILLRLGKLKKAKNVK